MSKVNSKKRKRGVSVPITECIKNLAANPDRCRDPLYFCDAIKTVCPQMPPGLTVCRILETLLEYYMSPRTFVTSLPLLQQLMPYLFPKLNTRKNVYVKLRKIIAAKFKASPFLVSWSSQIFHISKQESIELKKDYNKKVYNRHIDQKILDEATIQNIIDTCKQSADWRDQMIAVGLCTGARMVEIAKVTDFCSKGDCIEMKGLAKCKGVERKCAKAIAGGLTGDEICALVEKIRTSLKASRGWSDSISNDKISYSISRSLQPRVKKLLGPDYTFHKLRAIYAELQWNRLGKGSTMSKTAYYASVLGHKPESLSSSLSYQRYTI